MASEIESSAAHDFGAGARTGGAPTSATVFSKFENIQLLFDSINEAAILLSPDFKILEINNQGLSIDGRSRDEIVGKAYWSTYPGIETSELGSLLKRAMVDRQPAALKLSYQWPDGRKSWFESRIFPTTGGPLGVFAREVSEQHFAEEKLQHSEQRFRAAVDAIQGVLWTNTAQGEMIGEQPSWAELTGQTFAQYQGFGWADAVHPEDAQPTIDAWRKAVSTQTPFIFEHRVRRHDGEWRLFAIRAVPVFDTEGSIREWVGVHRDITERHRTQDQLQRNANTFANMVVSNPFGVFVVDADFKLINVSKGAEKTFENIEPLTGRDFAEILRIVWAEPFATEAISHFRHTLDTGEPYVSLTTVNQRANIDAIEAYDWRIERIELPDGRFGVVCFFYDLSERNSYEERLRLLIDEKEMLAREIDHRVKNSLAIVGSLLSMQRSVTSSEETRAALAEAASRVIAVARVHERLHKSHQVGIIAFAEYLEKLCRDIANSLQRSGVKLEFKADPIELPAEQALSLALVANELVTNAFKHGCAAGAKTISVSLVRRSDTLLLSVADDGAGLPQVHEAKPTGLGFKAIKTLSKQLGAVLTLPKPGSQAEFHLVVPYTAVQAADA